MQLDTRLAATAILAQAEKGNTFGLTVSALGAASAASGSTLSGQSNSQLTVGTGATGIQNQNQALQQGIAGVTTGIGMFAGQPQSNQFNTVGGQSSVCGHIKSVGQ